MTNLLERHTQGLIAVTNNIEQHKSTSARGKHIHTSDGIKPNSLLFVLHAGDLKHVLNVVIEDVCGVADNLIWTCLVLSCKRELCVLQSVLVNTVDSDH